MNRPEQPRVALFTRNVNGAGTERVTLNLLHGLVKEGLPVELVLENRKGDFGWMIPSGVPVHVFDVRYSIGRAIQGFRHVGPVARYLQTRKPDVVLGNLVYANWVLPLARQCSGVTSKLMLVEHNPYPVDLAQRPWRQRLKFVTEQHVRRRYMPRADLLVAPSQGMADDLAREMRMPPQRVRTLPNAVVSPALYQQAAEPLDHPWFAAGQPPVILGVGRLAWQKDFHTLLLAFDRLRRERPARLLIIGRGPLHDELEQTARQLGLQDCFQALGFKANPFPFMAQAALYVLSSRWEALSTTLIEAMALGTPVVAVDCPHGPRELLEDGRLGPLAPPQDVAALCRAMGAALDSPTPRVRLQERSQAYTIEAATRAYLEVIRELLAG